MSFFFFNSKEGHKAYIIPAGGSSTLGAWGYIDGFDEMMKQVYSVHIAIEYYSPISSVIYIGCIGGL